MCRQRHGAVAVRGGSVLGMATNIDKNDPEILEDSKVRMHASICAERRVLNSLSNPRGATIFVVRVRKNGAWAFSAPCTRCVAACEAAGIKKIIYSN